MVGGMGTRIAFLERYFSHHGRLICFKCNVYTLMYKIVIWLVVWVRVYKRCSSVTSRILVGSYVLNVMCIH